MSEQQTVTADPKLDFDLTVPPRGYAWWYIDGLSDDGRHGLTIIVFIGSVFSPYYFKGRRKGRDDPRDYCSVNVCLYGEQRRWTMTERRASAVRQETASLAIGPSAIRWGDDGVLTITFDERGMPIPRRVRGQVRLTPTFFNHRAFELDDNARHRWRPIAPSARIEVALEHPQLHWSGHGYFDRNWGDEPLEDAFVYWDWSRVTFGDAGSAMLYHAQRRQQTAPLRLGLHFNESGALETFTPPPDHQLPRTPIWRMPRASQADAGQPPQIVRTLEDTPFYSRSEITTHLLGQSAHGVHESLSLNRFKSPIVQRMLPYRMPRR